MKSVFAVALRVYKSCSFSLKEQVSFDESLSEFSRATVDRKLINSVDFSAMSDENLSSSALDQQVDHLIYLCAQISQMACRIRLKQCSNISRSSKYVDLSYNELLTMAENIEGSAILLESLLAVNTQNAVPMLASNTRCRYTRDELIQLQQRVSPNLSIQIKNSLSESIERECNISKQLGKHYYKCIRAILT